MLTAQTIATRIAYTTAVMAIAVAAFAGFAKAETQTTRTYIEYDANSDTYLEKKEFINYSYNVVDSNHDGKVDATEWTQYKTTFYEPIDIKMTVDPEFTYYDMDKDGFIDSNEYVKTYDTALFKRMGQR
ncbi:MAG: EF-hand domain-containing protein [Alphaproteobacteria bacterium]|nr:EF-hand domain-containing protein [Alphaproteobacteria bacterium]MCD8519797.1 EF-hand domain-containing protein [Alphaproteobacteria bacterium]